MYAEPSRRIVAAAGLDPPLWTPRELRHSFMSLLSSSGVPNRAHLPLGRTLQHRGDREGLPEGTTSGAEPRSAGHGCALWRSPGRSLRLTVGLSGSNLRFSGY